MVNRRARGRALLWLTAGFLVTSWAQEAVIEASVDRATIRENESFTYVLNVEGRVTGQPDPSVLERDFDIIDRSTRTRIQTVNGRTEQAAEWIYQLMPKAPGEFTLPALPVGDLQSNPVTINVLPALVASGEPADIFMEVGIDPAAVYVQAQVVYTLRLFIGIGTGRATLTAPPITGGEAIIERLGEDKQYQTLRDNKTFIVRERRYAIFPQQTGTLTIGPSTFEAMVIPNRGFSRLQRLRSDSIELEVKPAVPPPASHPNAVWLPAESLRLSERWADQEHGFTLGVPRTRILTIDADGLLETQLPELELGQVDGIRQYPDQPELERQVTETGLEVKRVERYAVIAQTDGEVTIPAAEVPWWNVRAERWEIARVEAQELAVAPSAEPAVVSPPPPTAALRPSAPPVGPGYWPWVSASLAAGWLLTVGLWLRAHRGARAEPRAGRRPSRPQSSQRLLKQLRAACGAADAKRAQQLLLEWAKLEFAEDPPQSLGTLGERVPVAMAAEIAALEAHLYGLRDSPWSGSELGREIKALDSVIRRGNKGDSDPLTPLYR